MRARLRRADEPAGLQRRSRRKAKPEQINQVAAAIKRAKRPMIYAGGGIITAEAQRRAAQAGQEDRHSRHDDRDGPGRLSRRRSAVARHARHARQRLRQLGRRRGRPADRPGRAVRRPRDRQGRGVRQARQDHPRRHRPLGDQQEQAGPHSRSCSDVKYALAELNKIVEAAGGHLRLGRAVPRVEEERAVQVRPEFRRHPASSTPSASCRS